MVILGWFPGVNFPPTRDISGGMSKTAHLALTIDVESDPITGSVSTTGGEAKPFSGWMELVAAIESARREDQTLGPLPGAKATPPQVDCEP
jgi:hypothetical protein